LVNNALAYVGVLRGNLAWLSDPATANFTTWLVNAWQFFPFAYLVILARLLSIPEEEEEAGIVEGASGFQRLRWLILPRVFRVVAVVAVLRFVWMFNKFDSVWLLTNGGPSGSTTHLPIYIFLKAFRSWDLGIGAAAGIIGVALLGLVAGMVILALTSANGLRGGGVNG
jgi:multiple sugar transport system permease protein